jgi:hypothetical protein
MQSRESRVCDLPGAITQLSKLYSFGHKVRGGIYDILPALLKSVSFASSWVSLFTL